MHECALLVLSAPEGAWLGEGGSGLGSAANACIDEGLWQCVGVRASCHPLFEIASATWVLCALLYP